MNRETTRNAQRQKSVLNLEVKSVEKKFMDKSSAAEVNRDPSRSGCEMLWMGLDAVVQETIEDFL